MSDATAKKEERRKFQAIRGVRDILPPETALWTRVEQTAHEVFSTYNFGEIRLPIFESTDLFARAVGGETDIVSKEMYTFEDRPQSIPDLTAFTDLGEYVTAVESALRRNEIPSTESNKEAVQALRKKFNDFAEASQQLKPGFSQGSDKKFETYRSFFYQAHLFAGLVELGDLLSLRPEATASVCRAYIEHNMQQLPQPVKLYYMGPMFRRERPQKGRYRQFYQIGAEVLDAERPDAARDNVRELAKDAAIDAEVIEMLMTFFDKVGLHGATLYINSIGHNAPNCRRGYVETLRAELTKIKDKLGADSQRRIDTNPLRVLDSKLEHEQPYIQKLPHIADHLCDDCKAHYAAVKRQLELRGVVYQENWRLVRGLDYYMRTTFEITAPGLGSQNAVCGGGRYDGLVELLGGPPTKGIGFAIGEDRLILSLQEANRQSADASASRTGRVHESPVTSHESPLVYIAWMGIKAHATAIRAAKDLRNAGLRVELPPIEQKFGKALGQADKLGAKYALILGDNEVSEALWTLKTLATGEQTKLPEPDLLQFLLKQ